MSKTLCLVSLFVPPLRYILPLMALLLMPTDAEAKCDESLTPIIEPAELAYKDRGDRCEGLYVQNISTTGLRIVAYHAGLPRAAENALALEIKAPSAAKKHLRISSTRARHYYRVDTEFDQDQYMFSLGLARRGEVGLKVNELAAVSCVEDCSTLLPVLVPTQVGQAEENAKPYILLQASKKLHSLRIQIVDIATDETVFDRELLSNTNWHAWRPAEMPVGQFLEKAEAIRVTIRSKGQSQTETDTISAILRR